MKKFFSIIMVAALLAACVPVELVPTEGQEVSQESTKTYTMIVKASKGNVQTRALDLVSGSPNRLNVKWAAGEEVSVFSEDWSSNLGTLTAAASETGSTSLSGDLTTVPASGDKLNLLFPRATWDYTGQTGVLLSDDNSIEKKYDYALAEVTVDQVSGNTVTTTSAASFVSQQAIVKFILKDKDNNDIPVTSLNISAASGKLVQSRSYSEGGWEPSVCEDPLTVPYFYLATPHMNGSWDISVSGFSFDTSFGESGYKQYNGMYICRLKKNNSVVPSTISIEIDGSDELNVSNVSFTNGAIYSYSTSTSVSKTTPIKSASAMQSIYGDLSVTSSLNNTLTVALLNESVLDTYTITANDGTFDYSCESPADTKFEKGKYYEVTMKMIKTTDISKLNNNYTVAQDGETLTGKLAGKYNITIPDGFTVTLHGVSINADGNLTSSGSGACITCAGNATIILKGTNTIKGFNYSDAFAINAVNKITIKGDGTLNAAGANTASGIHGYDIEIQGGNINATSMVEPGIGGTGPSLTNSILISGGQVSSTSTVGQAGIAATDIVITTGITRLEATGTGYCIGGTTATDVKFGTFYVRHDGSGNDLVSGTNYGGLLLDISGNTWTLTPQP